MSKVTSCNPSDVALEAASARLLHVEAHVNQGFDVDKLVRYVTEGLGDPAACTASLASHASAKAIHAWFGECDLIEFKRWFDVAARLRMRYDLAKPRTYGPYGHFQELIEPLMSDDEDIIGGRLGYDAMYDAERREKCDTLDFLAYQAFVALRGEWPQLGERAERALAHLASHPQSKLKPYEADHRFYLALARGDRAAMTSALTELVAPANVRRRAKDESGYTEDLVFRPAAILAKIAWRHGHELHLETPLIPAPWLPIQPLPTYTMPYAFLRANV